MFTVYQEGKGGYLSYRNPSRGGQCVSGLTDVGLEQTGDCLLLILNGVWMLSDSHGVERHRVCIAFSKDHFRYDRVQGTSQGSDNRRLFNRGLLV